MFSSHGTPTAQVITATADVQAHVRDIGRVLAALPLSPQIKAAGRLELATVEAALAAPEIDREQIADVMHRLTETLTRAGAFLLAGRALQEPIVAIAGWLGAPGDSVVRLLG
ncbi:hypothetical protein [Actinoplanes sp. NPDC020271]|uniref:hypothetical protein n=1 Tax=Actinoplanes sp. NPDC020271 TaxID=3363896 RepID=UPI0037977C05